MGIGTFFLEEDISTAGQMTVRNSDIDITTKWVTANFPPDIRVATLLVEHPNILSPEGFATMLRIYEKVEDFETENGVKLHDICIKTPNLPGEIPEETDDGMEILDFLIPTNIEDFAKTDADLYCDVIDSIQTKCTVNSVLQFYNFDHLTISNLTTDKILHAVNGNFSKFFGGKTYDTHGNLKSAQTTIIQWLLKTNRSEILDSDIRPLEGKLFAADPKVMEWEEKFVEFIHKLQGNFPDFKLYVETSRSFIDDTGVNDRTEEYIRLAVAAILVLIFINLTIGEWNCGRNRFLLSISGLLSVFLAVCFTNGVAYITGIVYSPPMRAIPIMLIAIGIDDMFIIIHCFDDLYSFSTNGDQRDGFPANGEQKKPRNESKELDKDKAVTNVLADLYSSPANGNQRDGFPANGEHTESNSESKEHSLEVRMSYALGKAGISVTATTVTNVLAFVIGGASPVPRYQNFCFYSAIGLSAVYILQMTYFLACFVLAERHASSNERTDKQSDRQTKSLFREFFASALFKTPGNYIALVFALLVFGFSLSRLPRLEVNSDMNTLLRPSSHQLKFARNFAKFFPELDKTAAVLYIGGGFDFDEDFGKLKQAMEDVRNSEFAVDFVSEISSWTDKFIPTSNFPEDLSVFLHSAEGVEYLPQLKFEKPLSCGEPAPKIIASAIPLRLFSQSNISSVQTFYRYEELTQFLRERLSESGQFVGIWSRDLIFHSADHVNRKYSVPSMFIVYVALFVVLILLFLNVRIAVFVFTMVIMTMVDVTTIMLFAGIHLNSGSILFLLISAGMSVDYSAHVAHSYLTSQKPTKQERAKEAVSYVGLSVFCGGFSTFLAFLAMVGSENRVFFTASTIILSMAAFGLFHGLVVLPIILSLLGTDSYRIRGGEESIEKGNDNPCFDNATSCESVKNDGNL